MARKRAVSGRQAEGAQEVQQEEAQQQQQGRQKTARREEQAAIARRRAAHFAHFGDAAPEEDSVHVGKNNARTLGPWSSAVELVNARQAAADQRNSKLQEQARQEQEEEVPWQPSRDVCLGPRPCGAVPSLHDVALRLLVQHIGAVTSLWGVPDSIRSRLAAAVAAQRKLTPEVALLFGHDTPTELVMPDCHQLEAGAMLDLLRLLLHGSCAAAGDGSGSGDAQDAQDEQDQQQQQQQAPGAARLERLELGACGRGFDHKAAAAVAAAGPLPALRVLSLGGAYRLGDEGLLQLLRAAPGLQELAVPSAPRLTGSFLGQLPALVPALTRLDVANCGGLPGPDLAALLSQLVGLQELVLDGIDEVDAQVMAAAGRAPRLRSLSVAFCRGVDDAALEAFAAARGGGQQQQQEGLQELVLDDCGAISDAGVLALLDGARGCRQLWRLSLAHCSRLTDASLGVLAERCGALEVLCLNSLHALGPSTLQALGRGCSDTLRELDVSFCRGLTEGSIGALVDRCGVLRELRVYSCTQLSTRFLHGHSRDGLQVLGLPTSCL